MRETGERFEILERVLRETGETLKRDLKETWLFVGLCFGFTSLNDLERLKIG